MCHDEEDYNSVTLPRCAFLICTAHDAARRPRTVQHVSVRIVSNMAEHPVLQKKEKISFSYNGSKLSWTKSEDIVMVGGRQFVKLRR